MSGAEREVMPETGFAVTAATSARARDVATDGRRFCNDSETLEAGIAPTLFIHQRCGRLIETLPALQHDPNRPEDVLKVDADEDSVGGDDAADAPRHWVATRSRAATARKLRGL
jgi:hypothetical protein